MRLPKNTREPSCRSNFVYYWSWIALRLPPPPKKNNDNEKEVQTREVTTIFDHYGFPSHPLNPGVRACVVCHYWSANNTSDVRKLLGGISKEGGELVMRCVREENDVGRGRWREEGRDGGKGMRGMEDDSR